MESTLTAVDAQKRHKSTHEVEIERLMALTSEGLNREDLAKLKRIRDAALALSKIEEVLEENKETRKLCKESLEGAILEASIYFDNRQLALNFGSSQ